MKKKCFLIFINLFFYSFQNCEIFQDCNIEDPECVPRKAEGKNQTNPHFSHGEIICPQYTNKSNVCCSNVQLLKLKENFNLIEKFFGNFSGGCDVCVENLKRFYCEIICNPNQNKFLSVGNITNHIIYKEKIDLLDVNLTLELNTSKQIFKSCNKVNFIKQIPSIQNYLGFLNFKGLNNYKENQIYLEIFSDFNKGLIIDVDDCDADPKNGSIRGINVEKCNCLSCEKFCNYDINLHNKKFEGFNFIKIIIIYSIIFILSIFIFFFKKNKNKNKIKKFIKFESQNEN